MRGNFDAYWINCELKKSCTTSKATFSHDLSDVDANYLFYELKVLQMSLQICQCQDPKLSSLPKPHIVI